jgi:hypothetical protein
MKNLVGCVVAMTFMYSLPAQGQWLYKVVDKETNETYILKQRPAELEERFHLIVIPDQGQNPTAPTGLPVGYRKKWITYYDANLREMQKQTQLLEDNNRRLRNLERRRNNVLNQ